MNDILQYLLKWSIALAVVFLFYRLALRPLTFYQWNRRYLIMYSLVAFLIPFINLTTYVQPERLQDSVLVQYIPAITINAQAAGAPEQSNTINILLIAGMVILAGSLLLSARLAVQWYSLHRIRRKAVRVYHPDATVYHVDENVIPFSFGNAIYVNTSLHTEKELNDIILHEFVHVRQKHSFDIIWSEILCILNWYNPFAWGIRHAIRQNLEFIADQAVLQHGLDKKTYQYHLLKVIGSPQYSIANNFNFSSLKKRIAMMNRLKSAKVHLVKFLFVLPLLAVLLVAFRQNENWYQQIGPDINLDKSDTGKKPIIKEDVEIRIVMLKEFYKMNPSVKEVGWSANDEIVIYLNNGQREAYRLKDDDDMKKYLAIYKAVPSFISKAMLPPPRSPKIATVPDGEEIILEEVILDDVTEASHAKRLKAHIKRNANVENVQSDEQTIIIKLKNGTTETYDVSKDDDVIRLEKKYGKLPPPPPPPPHKKVPGIEIPTPAAEMPEGVRSIEVENKVVTVIRQDGTVEKYDLRKPAEKAAVEKKYGEVIEVQKIPSGAPVKVVGVPVKADASSPEIRLIELPTKVDVTTPQTAPAKKSAPAPASKPVILKGDENGPASVKVIHDDSKQEVLYADKIVVHAGVPEWKLSPKESAKPVYYLNGKRAIEQDANKIAAISAISHMEIVSDPVTLKVKGEISYNAIINVITKENVYNKSAYLAKESQEIIEEGEINSKLINTLMLEEENPLDIKVDGASDDQIEVEMTGGQIYKRDGRYYARPNTTGNVQIRIYKKEEGKERKMINKRVFRVIQGKKTIT